MCDMTPSCVWHDSFMCMPRRIHTCDETHLYVWYDSFMLYLRYDLFGIWLGYDLYDLFIYATWLIHRSDMTHSYVWYDSLGEGCDGCGDRAVCAEVCWYISEETNEYGKRAIQKTWRVAKTIGCIVFIGHVPPKSLIINGSFAETDLQLKESYESSPPCTDYLSICVVPEVQPMCQKRPTK